MTIWSRAIFENIEHVHNDGFRVTYLDAYMIKKDPRFHKFYE